MTRQAIHEFVFFTVSLYGMRCQKTIIQNLTKPQVGLCSQRTTQIVTQQQI